VSGSRVIVSRRWQYLRYGRPSSWLGGRRSRATPGDDPLQATLARLDQSLGEFRPIEARLSGASYRPVVSWTRAPAPGADAPLDVRESANAVQRAALSAAPAAGARALAKMYLLTGRPDRAVDALAPFVSVAHDAAFLSDTSAAYFTRAPDRDRAHALDAAARAVEIEPRLVEAWFNLGLASEALGQYSLARCEGMGSRDRARSPVRVGPRDAGLWWRALIDLETGAALYLRALAAHVSPQILLFRADPVTLHGAAHALTFGPGNWDTELDRYREQLTATDVAADDAIMSSEFVKVSTTSCTFGFETVVG
jgi:tetratricopeptide (TPR) repeat protein